MVRGGRVFSAGHQWHFWSLSPRSAPRTGVSAPMPRFRCKPLTLGAFLGESGPSAFLDWACVQLPFSSGHIGREEYKDLLRDVMKRPLDTRNTKAEDLKELKTLLDESLGKFEVGLQENQCKTAQHDSAHHATDAWWGSTRHETGVEVYSQLSIRGSAIPQVSSLSSVAFVARPGTVVVACCCVSCHAACNRTVVQSVWYRRGPTA